MVYKLIESQSVILEIVQILKVDEKRKGIKSIKITMRFINQLLEVFRSAISTANSKEISNLHFQIQTLE